MGLALCVAARGGTAEAQVAALQGTPTVVAGAATVDSTGGTAANPFTFVTVTTPTAVINWVPTDSDPAPATPIDFLPSGGMAVFNGNTTDFTVLNRILPAAGVNRAIGLNGEVIAAYETGSDSGIGGNVWFYSPTGITAGAGSLFTVTGLILTANDIPFTTGPNGGITFGSGNAIHMSAASGSQAAVTVDNGAVISGQGSNAYVALVAPRVVQAGQIALDGSVGLVAAEEVDVRINMGLFDIDMIRGTSVTDALTVTGLTGGDQGMSGIGPQRIYLAALPKNTAINMLVGGTLGSTTASTVDGAVILSGGYDVFDTVGAGIQSQPDTSTTQPVNVRIGTVDIGENLIASATGTITGSPDLAGDTMHFAHNADLTAAGTVLLQADGGETIHVNGDLTMNSVTGTELRLGATPVGVSDPATVIVDGNLHLNSSVFGTDPAVTATGGSATIRLDASPIGPQLTVTGSTMVEASAFGAEASAGDAGSAQGGTAQVIVNGGTFSSDDTSILADAYGASFPPSGNGGNAVGGTALFSADGGSKATLSSLQISAISSAGTAAPGANSGSADNSAASAGFIASGAGTQVDVGGITLDASAGGYAGTDAISTTAKGGQASIESNLGAVVNVASDIHVQASAQWLPLDSGLPGAIGLTSGGIASVTAGGGTINANSLVLDTSATTTDSTGAQGDAVGGTITVLANDQQGNDGLIALGGILSASASGFGAAGATGGNGQGGKVTLSADGGRIDFSTPDAVVYVQAVGRAGLVSSSTVAGTGGTIAISASAGGTSDGFNFPSMQIDASGGGDYLSSDDITPFSAGDGPIGHGGSLTITASGGTLSGNVIDAMLNGTGGHASVDDSGASPSAAAASGFLGGTGQGGAFALDLDGGTMNVNALNVNANGFGGSALLADGSGVAGSPGQGKGGSITITGTAGSFTSQSLALSASGIGGDAGDSTIGGTGSALAGAGQGGNVTVTLGGASFVTPGGTIEASGFGGRGAVRDGLPGGSGTGGAVTLTATDAVNYALGDLVLSANGTAGDSTGSVSPSDGTGTGGTVKLINQGATDVAANSRTANSLTLTADGIAGAIGSAEGTNAVGGFVQYSDLAGGANGSLAVNLLRATALGLSAPAGNGALIESAGNPLNVTGTLTVDTAGAITAAANGSATISADSVSLRSSTGDVTITHAGQTTPASPTISAGQIVLDAAGSIAAAPASQISATTRLTLYARGGDITAGTLVSGGDFDMLAAGNFSAAALDVAGAPNMIGTTGAITGAGRLDIPGTLAIGDLTLRGSATGVFHAGGDLTINTARAPALDLTSDTGVLTLGGLSALGGGPAASLVATAPTLSLSGIAVSGDITGTATQATLSATDVTAGGALALTAVGAVTIGGEVTGRPITIDSGDIAIAPDATLGTPGSTSTITLTNTDASKVSYFGGADNAAGYSLSAAEIARLYGYSISLVGPQTPQSGPLAPDVVVGAMTLSGSATASDGQLGGEGMLAIQTPGRVLVDGAVRLTDASSDNAVSIAAGNQIMIDNQSGSIVLTDIDGLAAGTIDLSADRIMAVSGAAQNDLAGLSDPAAINARLGINDGAVNDQGVLRADTLRFAVAEALYIQNTGAGTAAAQRRGFDAGQGGIIVSAGSSTAGSEPLIAINGVSVDSQGASATGLDTIPLVTINGDPAPGASGAASGSTINGCLFADVATCSQLPQTPTLFLDPAVPTRDRLQAPVDAPADTGVDKVPTINTTEIDEIGRFGYEPLVDEPVTGSGNDDLWTPPCDPVPGGACAPSPAAKPPAK
jgi:hypothetical protein